MSRVLEALRQLHLLPSSGVERPTARVKPRLSAFVRQAVLAGTRRAPLFENEPEPVSTEPIVLFQVPRLTLPTLLDPPATTLVEAIMQPPNPKVPNEEQVPAEAQVPLNAEAPQNTYSLQAETPARTEKSLDQIATSLLEALALQPRTASPFTKPSRETPALRALPRTPATRFEIKLQAQPLEKEEEHAFNELAGTMREATRSIRLPLLALASLGENATSQAAILRLALRLAAEYGRPALLIDAAFAASPLSVALEREHYKGLSEVLSGQHPFTELLQATSFPNLDFLPVGRSISNSLAFALNSDDFAEQLRGMEDRYAVILCDVGTLRHPWSVAVARASDAAYLAVELGGTPIEGAVECVARFRESGGEFRGCVVLGSE